MPIVSSVPSGGNIASQLKNFYNFSKITTGSFTTTTRWVTQEHVDLGLGGTNENVLPYTLTHGLGVIPKFFFIMPTSISEGNNYWSGDMCDFWGGFKLYLADDLKAGVSFAGGVNYMHVGAKIGTTEYVSAPYVYAFDKALGTYSYHTGGNFGSANTQTLQIGGRTVFMPGVTYIWIAMG